VLDDQRQIIRIDGFMEDITDCKHAEEAIHTLNSELERRVAQRTAEFEAANKELKNFAYVVSHDLKAPLRGISHLVNWLVEDYGDAIDDKGREMANLLIGRVKRMDGLIEGILHYSRIGRIEEEHEAIDLNMLLREVLDLLNPPEHIRISLDPGFPTIVAERTRMFQVFQNLIGNAVKFLNKPHGDILLQWEDNGTHWTFRVRDNGPGIEHRHQEKIFQIFQTLRPRDEVESTGIGLALVKKIVELYGGKIWMESTVGEGSTFFFTLPKGEQL
jgi:light-regulated signal transduction histidine kinase (bacteriophytochrome)